MGETVKQVLKCPRSLKEDRLKTKGLSIWQNSESINDKSVCCHLIWQHVLLK